MKILIAGLLSVSLLTSCRSLTSTTYIKPNDAFLLGNNLHGGFSVNLKNESPNELIIWKTPVNGGQHSPVEVQPNETIKVGVERNTGIRIENNHAEDATVALKVKGDTGLSMGYQNN